MKKKIVLFVLPIFCLVMATGLLAEEKPVTIQELFENLPYNLVFHDNTGLEYHMTWNAAYGMADTYWGWIEDSTGYVYWYDVFMWIETSYFSFVITAITNNTYWGMAIAGDDWTLNTWTNVTGTGGPVDFYKGPLPSGFRPAATLAEKKQ